MTGSDGNMAVDFAALRLLSGQREEILAELNENVQTMHARVEKVEKVVLAWEGARPARRSSTSWTSGIGPHGTFRRHGRGFTAW